LIVAGGVASLGLVTVGAGPASAHYSTLYHGSDVAWVGTYHDYLRVQDRECDGNTVYAQGYDRSGYRIVRDPDGCAAGYGTITGSGFYQYRICESNVSCTSWRYT